jgi:hypothetical protein
LLDRRQSWGKRSGSPALSFNRFVTTIIFRIREKITAFALKERANCAVGLDCGSWIHCSRDVCEGSEGKNLKDPRPLRQRRATQNPKFLAGCIFSKMTILITGERLVELHHFCAPLTFAPLSFGPTLAWMMSMQIPAR